MQTVFYPPLQKAFDMDVMTVSVKQLNTYVKSLLESDIRLRDIEVTGEISNFKNHYSSGHWYFTLKDRDAQIRCVMFSTYASRVNFCVEDGMSVVIRGRVSIYERDGQYQFYAEDIKAQGEGDLAAAFNALKDKLQKEGIFDEDQKRPLKRYPQKIAVLTSDTGAAVRDIFNITSKRYPICNILFCPVLVQGENAPDSMIDMLERVYQREDVDTIIIGRGGGSLEDLWAFNSEALARKIYESPIPVISAVGHETDFTICDFVADVRASTPSHAAEIAVPDGRAILENLSTYKLKYQAQISARYELSRARYELILSSSKLFSPTKFLDELSVKIDSIEENILYSYRSIVLSFDKRLSGASAKLDALSPLKTISRGYAAVSSGHNTISAIRELSVGQDIQLRFSDGDADCKVTKLRSR